MASIDWWKLKKYWIKGGIIGFCVSVILGIISTYFYSLRLQCIDSPSCVDYFSMFTELFVFFAPMCVLIGIFIGFIIDKVISKNK